MPAFQPGRLNYKLLFGLLGGFTVLAAGLATAHYVRKNAIARGALAAAHSAAEGAHWPQAVAEFRRYLEKYPDDPEVLEEYADALLQSQPLEADDIGNAIAAYRRLIRIAPDYARAYEQLATLYTATHNYSELAYCARRRLERVPADPQATLWLASALLGEQKLEEARTALAPLVEQLSGSPGPELLEHYVDACVQLSRIAGAADPRSPEAAAWLDRAVALEPPSARARGMRARHYRTAPPPPGVSYAERLEAARADLAAADALSPTDPRVRLLLSQEWLAHGRFAEAAAELADVDDADEESLRRYFLRGSDWRILKYTQLVDLALRKNAPAEALPLTEEVLAQYQHRNQRLALLPPAIEVLTAAGRLADAEQLLAEYRGLALIDRPRAAGSETAALLEALVARAQQRPYEVIAALEPYLEQEVTRPKTLRLLANAFTETQQPGRAVEALSRYVIRQPEDREAALQLVSAYTRLGNWPAAVETARTARERWPEDESVLLAHGQAALQGTAVSPALRRITDLDQLGRELAELEARRPRDVRVRLLQAALAEQGGDVQRSESILVGAVDNCDEPLQAELMLARLLNNTAREADALARLQSACTRHTDQAAAWAALGEHLEASGAVDAARTALQDGLRAVRAGAEKRVLQELLALFELRHDQRAAGIALLDELAAADSSDFRVRSLLLDLPEVRQDPARAALLIAELRALQGDSGLLWRVHEAACWLSREHEWRQRQQEIRAHLEYAVAASPSWPVPTLLLGEFLERVGSTEQAESLYRRALAANPGAAEVAEQLLRILERQQRFTEARRVLDQFEPITPLAAEHHATIALQLGGWQAAIENLRLRVDADANDSAARVLLARLLFQQTRDADAALRLLDEIRTVKDPLLLVQARATILSGAGRADEARALLDAAVAEQPGIEALLLRAAFHASTGALADAEEDYRAVAARATDGLGHAALGNFLVESGRIGAALETWESGLAAHPDDAGLRRKLTTALLQQPAPAQRARALALLAELERDYPADPEVLGLRAVAHLQEGTAAGHAAAERLLTRVVELEPTAVDAHLTLVEIAMRRADYAAARDLAIRGRGANPHNHRLLLARARAELGLGNTPIALELARAAMRQGTPDRDTLTVFAEVALAARQRTVLLEALEALTGAAAQSSHDEQLQRAAARVLAALDRVNEALARLEQYRAAAGGDPGPEVLLVLAELHYRQGNLEAARALTQDARQRYPDDPKTLRALVLWHATQQEHAEIQALLRDFQPATLDEAALASMAAAALARAGREDCTATALTLAERACAAAPDSTAAQLGYAYLLFQTGASARAVERYRAVLAREPANARVLNDLAWALAVGEDRPAEALEYANRGLELEPGNLHLRDTRAAILMKLPGRAADARHDLEYCLRDAAAGSATRARALLRLARLCTLEQDLSGARAHLIEAREIDARGTVFDADERRELTELTALVG